MNISIVGCGWLGLPLASHLLSQGHNVLGTTRSDEKTRTLAQHHIKPHLFSLGDELDDDGLAPLFSVDALILNLPPGRRTLDEQQFVLNMRRFIDQCHQSGCTRLLFVSTTSVYGDAEGTVDENTETTPSTASGRAHVAIEKHVRDVFADRGTILRLAGLVNKQRHPVNFLSGREGIENGQQVVNLVHRDDVIAAIDAILSDNVFGETLVLCSNEHPARKEYYTWAAQQKELAVPQFVDTKTTSVGKTIDATRSIQKLGLKLKYPSPYDMI